MTPYEFISTVRLSQILMQDLKPIALSVPDKAFSVRLSQILMQDLKLPGSLVILSPFFRQIITNLNARSETMLRL